MPSNITPVNAWTTPLTAPAPGDPVDGGVGGPVFDMGQIIANRIEFLKERTLGTIANDPVYFPLIVLPQPTNYWAADFAPSGCLGLVQTSAATAWAVYVELAQPKYGILTALSVTLVGAAGHVALPTTLPQLALFRQDPGSSGTPTLVGVQSDTSASTAAYEVPHNISLGGLTETFIHDGGNKFYARIAGEAGANALTDLCVLKLSGFISPA
jgi:hypothetical protein